MKWTVDYKTGEVRLVAQFHELPPSWVKGNPELARVSWMQFVQANKEFCELLTDEPPDINKAKLLAQKRQQIKSLWESFYKGEVQREAAAARAQ